MKQLPEQGIFRAYDIRGIVDKTLTLDGVWWIGRAVATMALEKGQHSVITARDGRLSSPRLQQALNEGIMAAGCNVIDIGAVPTPLLYFATHTLATQSGVMITGSHNPPEYNGLKLVVAGETLAEERIQEIYSRIQSQNLKDGHGQQTQADIISNYLEMISKRVQLKRPLKVVVDCGNGIAGKVAPALFRKLGAELIELYCEVDGNFPHHHPNPSEPENVRDLIATVLQHHADVGIAFDGDGDRLGVISSTGEIIWPDRLMMLFAEDVLHHSPNSTVVFDVKCTSHLAKKIAELGGRPMMWKTGHSLIKKKMKEVTALLAGEMSGHLYFSDQWLGFDDALYAAARFMQILSQQPDSANLFEHLPNSINTPEIVVYVDENKKFSLVKDLQQQGQFAHGEIITIDGVRVEFKNGWGLMRASNTTPALIFRFEAENENALQQIKDMFKQQLKKIDKTLELPF